MLERTVLARVDTLGQITFMLKWQWVVREDVEDGVCLRVAVSLFRVGVGLNRCKRALMHKQVSPLGLGQPIAHFCLTVKGGGRGLVQ